MRILVGLACVFAGFAAAIGILAFSQQASTLSVLLACACVTLGYLSLSITRSPEAPLRPARLALLLSVPPGLFMLVGVSWPHTGTEIVGVAVLLMGVIVPIAVVVGGSGSPRASFIAVAGLAVYGVSSLAAFAPYLSALIAAREGPPRLGPAETLGLVLGLSFACAWIAALWHSRSLLAVFRTPAKAEDQRAHAG